MAIIVPIGIDFCGSAKSPERFEPAIIPAKYKEIEKDWLRWKERSIKARDTHKPAFQYIRKCPNPILKKEAGDNVQYRHIDA